MFSEKKIASATGERCDWKSGLKEKLVKIRYSSPYYMLLFSLSVTCVDLKPNCDYLAKTGDCFLKAPFMEANCAKSCLCGGK